MAAELGTDLTRVTVGARDIGELLPRAIELSEKPTLRTSLAPLLRLSGAVQDAGLKVVLTGEGADELFAGYDIFREDKVRRFWARDPDSRLRPLLFGRLNAFLARDVVALGGVPERLLRARAGGRGRSALQPPDPVREHGALPHAVPAGAARPGGRRPTTPLARLVARLPEGYDGFSSLGKAQYLEITTFLEGYLLHSQGDRMLMGHSIEGRFPFLDYRVAELAARLPDRLRLRGLEEKYAPAQGGGARCCPKRCTCGRSAPTGRRSGRPSSARTRRSTFASSCSRERLEEAGSSRPEAVRRVRREVRGGRVGPGRRDRRDGAGRRRLDHAAARAAGRPSLSGAGRSTGPGRGRRDGGARLRAGRLGEGGVVSWAPPQRLLHESLLAAAADTPEKPALVADGRSWSYAELREAALRLARALQDAGLERGDRVVIFMDNTARVRDLDLRHACSPAASSSSPTRRRRPTSSRTCWRTARPPFLLTENSLGRIWRGAVEGVGSLRGVFCAGKGDDDAAHDLQRALAAAEPAPREPARSRSTSPR